jgi:8-oxo-dGTP diphosphatase
MKVTEVAAAVILRPDGSFLLGQRAPGTFYAGYWEFPGGKVEPGETPHDALVRELSEELGIAVDTAYPWIVREHRYEHAHVRLHFFRVVRWHGELHDHVHSALAWQRAADVTVAPMLPANAPVLAALGLPAFYAITHAQAIGVGPQLKALEHALAGGLRLVLLREPELPPAERRDFAVAALALCRHHGARLLVARDETLAREIGADGLHLSSAQLMQCAARPRLPLVAASCHDAAELAQAEALGLDFAVLGPVRPTASHPRQQPMGWPAFAALAHGRCLPVYALGGMGRADGEAAWQAGAHGVAAIRDAWQGGEPDDDR